MESGGIGTALALLVAGLILTPVLIGLLLLVMSWAKFSDWIKARQLLKVRDAVAQKPERRGYELRFEAQSVSVDGQVIEKAAIRNVIVKQGLTGAQGSGHYQDRQTMSQRAYEAGHAAAFNLINSLAAFSFLVVLEVDGRPTTVGGGLTDGSAQKLKSDLEGLLANTGE
jgi:hypothetical protein